MEPCAYRQGCEPRASGNLGPEGVRVPVQCGHHCLLPRRLVLSIVAAVHAVAAITVGPRGEALAVPAPGQKRGLYTQYPNCDHSATGLPEAGGTACPASEKKTTGRVRERDLDAATTSRRGDSPTAKKKEAARAEVTQAFVQLEASRVLAVALFLLRWRCRDEVHIGAIPLVERHGHRQARLSQALLRGTTCRRPRGDTPERPGVRKSEESRSAGARAMREQAGRREPRASRETQFQRVLSDKSDPGS